MSARHVYPDEHRPMLEVRLADGWWPAELRARTHGPGGSAFLVEWYRDGELRIGSFTSHQVRLPGEE
jgi:hypothetical protein